MTEPKEEARQSAAPRNVTMAEKEFEAFCDDMELAREGLETGAGHFAHPTIFATLVDLVNQIGTLSHAVDIIRKEIFYGDRARPSEEVAAAAAVRVLSEPYENLGPKTQEDGFDSVRLSDCRMTTVEIAQSLVAHDFMDPDQRWVKENEDLMVISNGGAASVGGLLHAVLGMLGDASELSQETLRLLVEAESQPEKNLARLRSTLECGDIRVWMRLAERNLGVGSGRVRAMVVDKLRARHKGEKFDPGTGQAGARDYGAEESAADRGGD